MNLQELFILLDGKYFDLKIYPFKWHLWFRTMSTGFGSDTGYKYYYFLCFEFVHAYTTERGKEGKKYRAELKLKEGWNKEKV